MSGKCSLFASYYFSFLMINLYSSYCWKTKPKQNYDLSFTMCRVEVTLRSSSPSESQNYSPFGNWEGRCHSLQVMFTWW